MKRGITFCSAPLFSCFSRCFPKRRKVISWRRFSFFFIQKKEKGRNERIRSRTDKKGKERGGEQNWRKKRKRGDASPALLLTSSKPEEGEHASSTKREERKPSSLSFSFSFFAFARSILQPLPVPLPACGRQERPRCCQSAYICTAHGQDGPKEKGNSSPD